MKEISKAQLLPPEVWNSTQKQFPREKCIHHLFEEQAAKSPEAVAVEFEGECLTYAALEARANQLAARLCRLGVGPDVIVAIYVQRSLETVVGVLGILKAGGAYLPLDPAYPKERLQFMLADAGASVVVTQVDLGSDLPPNSVTAVCLNSIAGQQETSDPRPIAEPVRSENLAYVIYTSGSTGRPKGVAMPHGPLANLIAWQLRNSKAGLGARTLQFAPLSFDVSFQEMFSTWCAGGTLVLISEKLRRDPIALLRLIVEDKIERLFLPFIALQQLAEAFGDTAAIPPVLCEIITAGEQLQITPKIVKMFESLPACTLHNQYGPSESHVVTAYTLSGQPSRWPPLPPIGRPIANTYIHLLDEKGQPVSTGERGEIYIGGDCLARGYLHRPDLTSEKFVPDPFSGAPTAKLYRTGDLGRCQPDGNIEFLGRLDYQVKIRGYRIELGEIETVLAECPAVREAVVGVRENEFGRKSLVAYVVLRNRSETGSSAIRDYLKAKLPEYMVPSTYMPLERLPLTPSGKVDRKALPKPEMCGRLASTSHVAPRDDQERRLVEIWQQVLALDGLGVNDSFRDLGGDSLRAIELIYRVESAFGVRLPVESVYQAPTVAQFRSLLDQQTTTKAPSGVVSFQDGVQGTALFCVHGMPQQLAQLLKPDFQVYGLHSPMEEGVLQWLQTGCLELTVEELAARYLRILKTVQPQGPYYLAGFSFGGLLAFEIARQLRQEQQQLILLCILDSFYVGGLKPQSLPWLRKWTYHSRMIMRSGLGHLVGRLKARCKRAAERQSLVKRLEKHDSNEMRSQARRIWQAQQEYMDAAARLYRVNPYPVDILLFRAIEETPLFSYMADGTNGWESVVRGKIDVVDIKCSHAGLIEAPYAQVVAKKLRTFL